MGSNAKIEVPVFAETNLGTRIAVAVSPDITAGDFKRELERAHIECFPELGIPNFKTVMVKQQSKFYCLPDLLPLKSACYDCRKLWFVNVVGCISDRLGKFQAPKQLVTEWRASNRLANDCIKVRKNFPNVKHKKRKLTRIWSVKAVQWGRLAGAYASKKKRKRKKSYLVKKCPTQNDSERLEQECLHPCGEVSGMPEQVRFDPKEVFSPPRVWDSNTKVESPNESFSTAISVSSIIDRYFSNLIELNQIDSPSTSEVASKAAQNQLAEQSDAERTAYVLRGSKQRYSMVQRTPKLLPSNSPEYPNSIGLRRKYERSEVGERLLTASNNLHQCQSKQRSFKSKLSKDRKFWEQDACSVARCLVFEIGDDD